MSPARQKINNFSFASVLVIAGIVGLSAGSWTAFCVVASVCIAVFLLTGLIRPEPRSRHGPRK